MRRHESATESGEGIAIRAAELFRENELHLQEKTDRMFAYLMVIQWIAGIVAALWISPRAWSGQTSYVHIHVWAALFLGGAIVSFPLFLALTHPGEVLTRHAIAVAQMLDAALLIHLTGGRVETHFQIFGLLAILAFYRDWRVLLTAAALTAADHVLRGLVWPQSIYGVGVPSPFRWIEHAGWVLFECSFLVVAIGENRREMLGIAHNAAELEVTNANIERKVIARTKALTEEIAVRRQQEEELAKARDAALAAVRLKAEFLANMSHEIRTPMNGIIGMTGILLDTELLAEQREYVEIIRSCGDGLLTLVNDILDFSKIEAGKMSFELLELDLRETTESVIDLLAEQAASKKLELISFVEADVPSGLRGDPGRLRQVLLNLIGNAIKFTEKGEVIVHGMLQSETDHEAVVRFTVQDSGIGISQEGCKGLFQAFTQADGSTTRKYGGTGLGLAISKRIVEMMNGEIGVHSTPGVGSTFWFTVKLAKQRRPTASKEQPILAKKRLRVLIVDDNEVNRMVVRLQLKSWGIASEEAGSAQEALAQLARARDARQPFDALLLDMQMPDVDGLQLAQKISADASLATSPMIMMTSLGSHDREREAQLRAAGVSICLTKPVKQSKLYDSIIRMISYDRAQVNQEDGNAKKPAEAIVYSTPPEGSSVIDAPAVTAKSRAHILVAEDNPVNQKVILRQLQKLGYRADAVNNGLEVLAALEQIRYDLVLMDCSMPEMDGYTAAQEIRRRQKGRAHLPIIALTAHTLQGDAEKCQAAGMDDHLGKPVKVEALEQKLSKWLSKEQSGAHAKSQPAPAEELIDMDALNQSADGDPEFLREMLDLYLSQGSQQIAALRAALNSGALSDVEKIAHSLAGASMTFGMRTIVSPLRRLESMARQGHLKDEAQCLDAVVQQFGKIRTFLLSSILGAAA